MAIKKVLNPHIKQARLNMRNAHDAYKDSIKERDKLIIELYSEGYTVEYLATEFQVSRDKVNDLANVR